MGKLSKTIEEKISTQFKPVLLEITNESDQHVGPKGRESHFKVLIISDHFIDKSRIERQREVLDLLAEELKGEFHALSLRILTSNEAHKKGFETPDCSHK